MNQIIGYALVSKAHRMVRMKCPRCPTSPRWASCDTPRPPNCHAACIRDPRLLAQHPDCQEYQRQFEAWYAAHYEQKPNGGTRLGPLHYFQDCRTLLSRGPRRADARIIALDPEMARALDLPTCRECMARMSPFEAQVTEAAALANSENSQPLAPPTSQKGPL